MARGKIKPFPVGSEIEDLIISIVGYGTTYVYLIKSFEYVT